MSLVTTPFLASEARRAAAVDEEIVRASLLVDERTETVALMRTASGTTVVVPVALIVMYRVSAADAGTAKAAPATKGKMSIAGVKIRR
jgi:hypothetical protein